MAEILETIGPRMGSAPYTTTLNEIGVVYPESVFCHFDGTGASGSFLTTLTIKSQNGTILARYFPDTECAAGDTADVTFSPFFRRRTTAASDTFAQVVATLATTHDLRGYWRLGDGSSPYADTSGNAGGPVNMVRQVHGVAMTQDYTPGALPPAQDDGAVAFNATTSFTQGDNLQATDARFQLTGLTAFSVAAFVKPFAYTTQEQIIVGTQDPANGGYQLEVAGTTGIVAFEMASAASSVFVTGGTIPANQWSFLVGVYGPDVNRKRIYVNGVLTGDTTSAITMAARSGLRIGGNGSGGPAYWSLDGAVDEVTVWGDELTAFEIATLATAAGY